MIDHEMGGVTTFMRVKTAKYEEKLKLAFKGQNVFGNFSHMFCASFSLDFESSGPIFTKLTYKDNSHPWPITRLLISLKQFNRKLSGR